MRTVTRADVRAQALSLADRESDDPTDGFANDTVLNAWFNTSLGIWHGLVARAVPERYEAATPQTITANGAASYALPDDHLWTIGVDFRLSSTCDVPLRRVQVQERAIANGGPVSQAAAYRLKGNTLVLLPTPSSGTYIHHYVTCAPTITDDITEIDCVNGWEEWLVHDLARRILKKEESDTSEVVSRLREVQAEIESAAQEREAGMPSRIVDTRLGRWVGGGRGRSGDPDFWSGR